MGQTNRQINANEDRNFTELIQKLNKIEEFVQKHSTTSRMEERFQDVPYKAVYLKEEGEDRSIQLKQWLGASCKEIFSIGFALFKAQELDEKKVKAFCSDNILRHILHFSQANKLSDQDFRLINSYLQKDLLPYFCLKYPMSEDKQANLGQKKKIDQFSLLQSCYFFLNFFNLFLCQMYFCLQKCNLQNLSQICERFGNSEVVVLDDNKITEIEEDCKKLTKIREMTLSSNKIANVDNIFKHLETLTILDISQNQITSLPQNVGNLELLKILNMRKNKIGNIPSSLGNLRILSKLNIQNNLITTLPQSIGNLKELRILNAHHNKLTELPSSLCKLGSLTQLNVSFNELKTFPEEFHKLKSLQKLNAENNLLSKLPQNIGLIAGLQQIQLRENKLTQIPGTLLQLKQLYKFEIDESNLCLLSQNFLEKINEKIAAILALKSIEYDNEESQRFPPNNGRTSLTKSYAQSLYKTKPIGNNYDLKPVKSVGENYNSNLSDKMGSKQTPKKSRFQPDDSDRFVVLQSDQFHPPLY